MLVDLKDKTVLLLGASGQLGLEFRRFLDPLTNVVCRTRSDVDLSDVDTLSARLADEPFDIMVNAMAYTDVEKAEAEPELAYAVNATATGILAELCEHRAAPFVHFSTDFVFDGNQRKPYIESDVPNPLSVYGASKLAGEAEAVRNCSRSLILRTSWLFSEQRKNFLKSVLSAAKNRDELTIVNDQVGCPTSTQLLTHATASMLSQLFDAPGDDSRWGIYHVAAKGSASWYDYGRYAVVRAHSLGIPLRTQPDSVLPVSSSQYPQVATRPAYSVLNTDKARLQFDFGCANWKDEVDIVLGKLKRMKDWQ